MTTNLWEHMLDPTVKLVEDVGNKSNKNIKLTNYKCSICNLTIYNLNDKKNEDHASNHGVEIIKRLYLGAVYNAHNLHELSYLKINTIVNAAYEVQNKFHDAFTYKKLMWDDIEDQNIFDELDKTISFVHSEIEKGKNVLVHCYMGKSRSVSIIMAYLMKYHNMSLEESLKFVKNKKQNVMPNRGFMNQLNLFKNNLHK